MLDYLDKIKQAALWVGAVLSAIAGVVLMVKNIRKWREENPSFKRRMMKAVERLTDLTEDMQKESEERFVVQTKMDLERSYTLYVRRLGWCPPGDKSALLELYDLYSGKGYNHLAANYKERIEALPESQEELDLLRKE